MFAWFGGRKPAWKKKNIKNFWKNDSLGEFFSILYIPSKRDVLSPARCRLWYRKSSNRESYAEERGLRFSWCCVVEPVHMNLHRLGMACPYLDWPMRILSGMSFSLILGLLQKIRFWYCLDVLRNVWQLMAERFRATGSAPKAREVRAAALPQSWQVTGRYEPDLWSKKLNMVYLFMDA